MELEEGFQVRPVQSKSVQEGSGLFGWRPRLQSRSRCEGSRLQPNFDSRHRNLQTHILRAAFCDEELESGGVDHSVSSPSSRKVFSEVAWIREHSHEHDHYLS
jgi:hypothetical protein